jgi:hypothetical protein
MWAYCGHQQRSKQMDDKGKELYAAISATLIGYSAGNVLCGMKRLRKATSEYFAEYEAELSEKARGEEQERRYEAMRKQDMET